jgi:transposase-like protein
MKERKTAKEAREFKAKFYQEYKDNQAKKSGILKRREQLSTELKEIPSIVELAKKYGISHQYARYIIKQYS